MTTKSEKDVELHIAAAEKALKKSFFHSPDYDIAQEHYTKVSTYYKMQKSYLDAAKYAIQASDCAENAHDYFNVGQLQHEAGWCYSLAKEFDLAKDHYLAASEAYVNNNQFSMAAKSLLALHEILDTQDNLIDSMKYLKKAIEYKEAANEPIAASQLQVKVAHLAERLGDYDTAQEVYEKIAKNASFDSSSADAYVNASFCAAASGDPVLLSRALDKYLKILPRFGSCPEFNFLDQICKALETNNLSLFDTTVKDAAHNRVNLTHTQAQILPKIRSGIKEAVDNSVL